MTIPYYMEIMGVDRPSPTYMDGTSVARSENFRFEHIQVENKNLRILVVLLRHGRSWMARQILRIPGKKQNILKSLAAVKSHQQKKKNK